MLKHIEINEERLAEICRDFLVAELALFGSVLRDDFGEDSDIDVLVEFEPGARVGLFEFGDLKEELSAHFGRDVDLVSKDGLHEHIRQGVLDSAQVIYSSSTGYRAPRKLSAAKARAATPIDRDALHLHVAGESCAGITEIIAGKDRSAVEANDLRYSAMLFELVRLSEALNRLSPEVMTRYPDIPWQQAIEAGRGAIENYRNQNRDEIWGVVTIAVPLVHRCIESILAATHPN